MHEYCHLWTNWSWGHWGFDMETCDWMVERYETSDWKVERYKTRDWTVERYDTRDWMVDWYKTRDWMVEWYETCDGVVQQKASRHSHRRRVSCHSAVRPQARSE